MFTAEQLRQIKLYLELTGRKDSQFPDAKLPMNGSELLAFVLNGINVKMPIGDLFSLLLYSRIADFINVSTLNSLTNIDKFESLEEVLDYVTEGNRKPGMIITFFNTHYNDWDIWEYLGTDPTGWYNLSLWNNLLDENLDYDRLITRLIERWVVRAYIETLPAGSDGTVRLEKYGDYLDFHFALPRGVLGFLGLGMDYSWNDTSIRFGTIPVGGGATLWGNYVNITGLGINYGWSGRSLRLGIIPKGELPILWGNYTNLTGLGLTYQWDGTLLQLGTIPAGEGTIVWGNKVDLAVLSYYTFQGGKGGFTVTPLIGGTPLFVTVSFPEAGEGEAGLMTPEDKEKLDGIEAGALKNVQSDWNVTLTTSDAYIRNKPNLPSTMTLVLTTGLSTTAVMSLKAVTDAILASISESGANVLSDWNETNTASFAYILNKPAIPSNMRIVQTTGLSTVDIMSQKAVTDAITASIGGSGANVRSDWNVTDLSSYAYILNKPNIPSSMSIVLTTGQSTTDVMSLKAVTDALDTKADKNNTYTKDEVDDKIEAAQGGPGFGKVTIGSTTVAASTPNDLITLIAGDNMTITPNASGKSVTFASTASGGGGANLILKSFRLSGLNWTYSGGRYVLTVTDADITDGSYIEAYPVIASLLIFEASEPYADLQPTVGLFIVSVRNQPTNDININYTIIG